MRWTDEMLDLKRQRGDDLADKVVDELFRNGEVGAVNELMSTLVRNDGLPSDKLPKIVLDYLAETSAIPIKDMDLVRAGEALFGTYGPEMLMSLGFYSLPASYAAAKGVKVLYNTAYLLDRAMRRVFETTQMVIDVMASNGLDPEGRGVRSAQKVRLMHAAIRHLTLNDPHKPWDTAYLGIPINQEDLAGTLMTFSLLVIEGLQRLKIHPTAAEQEAYLHVWQVMGPILGLDDDLIPANLSEATELTTTIRRRQIAASIEGTAMTKALIDGFQTIMPRLTPGLASSMVHYFLDNDPLGHQNVAALLGVQPANWTKILVDLIADVSGLIGFIGEGSKDAAAVIRFFSRPFVKALLDVERGGNRAKFYIPEHLQEQWEVGP